jgi:hypothetical protein
VNINISKKYTNFISIALLLSFISTAKASESEATITTVYHEYGTSREITFGGSKAKNILEMISNKATQREMSYDSSSRFRVTRFIGEDIRCDLIRVRASQNVTYSCFSRLIWGRLSMGEDMWTSNQDYEIKRMEYFTRLTSFKTLLIEVKGDRSYNSMAFEVDQYGNGRSVD